MNTHNPEFLKSIFEVRFKENLPAGSKITEVIAKDKDGDPLVYLIQSDELKQFFRLDPSTGELWSEKVLDRETRASYEIPITVTDQGGRNGFTTIKITVVDENDNSPFFPLSVSRADTRITVDPTVRLACRLALYSDSGKKGELSFSSTTVIFIVVKPFRPPWSVTVMGIS